MIRIVDGFAVEKEGKTYPLAWNVLNEAAAKMN